MGTYERMRRDEVVDGWMVEQNLYSIDVRRKEGNAFVRFILVRRLFHSKNLAAPIYTPYLWLKRSWIAAGNVDT